MSNYETIRELVSMLNLHARGKKMRALEILEDFLFGTTAPGLIFKDLQVLLLGYEGNKGILQAMGAENRIRKSLKNSAHYALQLAVKIFNTQAWRLDVNTVLESIDRLQVQQMKLDKHFKSAESSKNFAVYYLCYRISTVKPAISAEVMISRKNFRDKFIVWAKAQKEVKIEMEAKEKPKSIGDILGLKPYITIPANMSAMILNQMDVKSQYFKPQVFVGKGHGNMTGNDIAKGLENLRKTFAVKQIAMGKTITENSIIFGETRGFFDELKQDIALQLTEGNAFKAHETLSACEATENFYLSPLLKQRAEMERVKRLLQLTSKYSYLFKLPNTLQSHLVRNDIESIIDLYQKHVVIIKTYSHLPVFSKVVKNLDSVIAAVKSFILQELRKNKKISMENVNKSIGFLDILDPKNPGIVDVAQVIYEVIDNYLESMLTRVDKQHELPWLLKETAFSSDLALQQQAVEGLIIRILDTIYIYIDILSKLSSQFPGKQIKRKMQKVSITLTKKLSMSLFQDDSEEPLRLVSIDEISFQIKKIAKALNISSFQKFCEEFTISVIKTKFHLLQKEISELWKDEIWSKDFENKNGTCMPRVFQCMVVQAVNRLKETLPEFEENMLEHIGEGVGSCSLSLLQAMKVALNMESTVNLFVSKSQRALLTLTNTHFLTDKVFPQINLVLEGLFAKSLPGQTDSALTETTTQVAQFSDALKSYFIDFKASKFSKIIEGGMTYTEENIGLDANIFYKHLLAQRREMKEIRGYINEIIGKLIKVINQLDRKCPQLKRELLEMLVEEIADCMRKTIQKNHRTLDAREICQVWAEIEFYQRFLNNFKVPSIEKCFTNLRKIFSKSKGLSKLATESEIFPDEFRKSKESLIKKELVRNKLLQSCLD